MNLTLVTLIGGLRQNERLQMRTELLSNTFNEFHKRFDVFHDALIKGVMYDFAASQYPGSMQVILDTWDCNEGSAKNRTTLIIELEGVMTVHLRKLPPQTITVIGMLDVIFAENEIALDFFPSGVPFTSLSYEEIIKIKGPLFIVVAKRCFWKILEKEVV